MKKYLFLIPVALLAFAACGEKEPEQKPTDTKTFSVSPASITAKADDTSASITVSGNVAWTAKSDNEAALSLSPASGNGAGTIQVTFAANTAETPVTASITVATTEDVKTKSYVVSFTQAGAENTNPGTDPDPGTNPDPGTTAKDTTYLAVWHFKGEAADNPALTAHFAEEAKNADKTINVEAQKPGNGGWYVEPNVTGKGRIEYYNGIDKSTVDDVGRCKRVVGNGALCQFGPWKEDYWLLTASTDNELPAGTTLYFFAALRANTAVTPKHWLAEIKDGDSWVPAMEVQRVTVDGVEVAYNMELTFKNSAAKTPEDPNANTVFVDTEYVLKAATKDPQLRITCVTVMYAETGGPASKIGDYVGSVLTKAANPVVMLVGERSNGGCEPVMKSTMICTVKDK